MAKTLSGKIHESINGISRYVGIKDRVDIVESVGHLDIYTPHPHIAVNQRVLLVAQLNPEENGVFQADSGGILTRVYHEFEIGNIVEDQSQNQEQHDTAKSTYWEYTSANTWELLELVDATTTDTRLPPQP